MATNPISPEIQQGQRVFEGNESSSFWVGTVSVGNVIMRPECYNPLLQFRGNVYVHELNYLQPDVLDPQGREIDSDDSRSALFAAIENGGEQTEAMGTAESITVVGSARLIRKETTDEPLPIEKYFSEIFGSNQVDAGKSAEISRFIARHPEKSKQRMLSLALVRAMVQHCNLNDIENTYAMMERPLVRTLSMVGLPMADLGEPKHIPELNGVLHPVVFYPQEILEVLNTPGDPRQQRLERFLGSVADDPGQRFYGPNILEAS